jgi:hypothetical protein
VAGLAIEEKRCARCRSVMAPRWTLERCLKCEIDRRLAAALKREEARLRKKETMERRMLTHDLLAEPLPTVE